MESACISCQVFQINFHHVANLFDLPMTHSSNTPEYMHPPVLRWPLYHSPILPQRGSGNLLLDPAGRIPRPASKVANAQLVDFHARHIPRTPQDTCAPLAAAVQQHRARRIKREIRFGGRSAETHAARIAVSWVLHGIPANHCKCIHFCHSSCSRHTDLGLDISWYRSRLGNDLRGVCNSALRISLQVRFTCNIMSSTSSL